MSLIQHLKINKAIYKIALLILFTILLMWLVCYKYVNNLFFLSAYLLASNILYLILFKPISNLKLWKLWYKKMIFLFIVNLLFAFLDIRFQLYDRFLNLIGYSVDIYHNQSKIEYYKFIILRTFLTLMSTILTLDALIKMITFSDLIKLPINIHIKKKMLFFRSILNFLTEKVKLNEVVTDIIPEYQHYTKRNKFLDFKYHFKKNLISIFMMIKLVHEQSLILGELIDNKINHTNHKQNGT